MTIEEGILTNEEIKKIDEKDTLTVINFLKNNKGNFYTVEYLAKKEEIDLSEPVISYILRKNINELKKRFINSKDFYSYPKPKPEK